MARPFDPLNADSDLVGTICKLCNAPLLIGQRPSLVVDAEATYTQGSEALERKKANRPHNATAVIVHWSCVEAFNLQDS